MKSFKKVLVASAMGLVVGLASSSASAVVIGGLTVPVGPHFEVASIYENVVTAVGQTLAGVGEITQINGVAISSLCSGCELTYRFGGYTVSALSATQINFSGGYINFYLGYGAANDFNPFGSVSSAADLAAATNGTLFLSMAGHAVNAAGDTFIGTGTNIGLATAVGNGSGLADVDLTGLANGNTAGAGAIANSNFNTNSIAALFGGLADFQIGSSFSSVFLPHPAECAAGTLTECLAGSADIRGLVIPEPGSIALIGISLLGLGLARRGKKQA
jgi:hypothetical protein